MNMLIKNESSSNETPPLSDPQNDYSSIYNQNPVKPYFHPLNLILKKNNLFKISVFSMDSSSRC
jgi:hypothetical protein